MKIPININISVYIYIYILAKLVTPKYREITYIKFYFSNKTLFIIKWYLINYNNVNLEIILYNSFEAYPSYYFYKRQEAVR